ncbi:unnamed protein product [Phytophthora fragariaefolia]|uniref:Unnamed protein product n=1 Tax=Phytophthora fragariaefolia TaxID=1490495 RepID=A0A9W6XVP5_9STRA|nr:unnamed protein product [Phytophthora fragariaefolia]
MDRSASIPINNVRSKHGENIKFGDGKEGRACFYCFKGGHFKTDCPVMAADRNPNHEGGRLFRTDIKTAPGAKVVRKTATNTRKAVIGDGKNRLNKDGKTTLEKAEEDQMLDDIKRLDPNNQDNGSSAQSLFLQHLAEVEEMVPITPGRSWFTGSLQPGQSHVFTYGNGTVSHSALKGSIKLVVNYWSSPVATVAV